MKYNSNDKSIPPLRQWELNDNSTRYEINVAAPSDDELVKYWYGWSIIALSSGIFVLVIFLSILLAPIHIRKQSFNLYLLFLMIPDILFSLLCGITCTLNVYNGSYYSHVMCQFQQWYCIWGIGSNCWLNSIITYELHKLLCYNNIRKKYKLPSSKRVILQSISVYIYCGFLGTWGLYTNPTKNKFPLHAIQISGLACIPVEIDLQSSLFFWFCYMPLYSGIPIIYVLYVCYDIYHRNLLPPSGKRRLLSLYFGRIIMVFLIMWGPYFLLNYILATWLPTSVIFAGGTFSHFQGPVSASVSLLKPDIWYAVKRFLSCQCCTKHSAESTASITRTNNNGSRDQRPYRSSEELRQIAPGINDEDEDSRSRKFFRRMSNAVRNSTKTFFTGVTSANDDDGGSSPPSSRGIDEEEEHHNHNNISVGNDDDGGGGRRNDGSTLDHPSPPALPQEVGATTTTVEGISSTQEEEQNNDHSDSGYSDLWPSEDGEYDDNDDEIDIIHNTNETENNNNVEESA